MTEGKNTGCSVTPLLQVQIWIEYNKPIIASNHRTDFGHYFPVHIEKN